MRILKIPNPQGRKAKNWWFASRLQFETQGSALLIRLIDGEDTVAIGKIDLASGRWEETARSNEDFEFYPGPWRQDYSCVVEQVCDFNGYIEIQLAVPMELHAQPPVRISRTVHPSPEVFSLAELEFSRDGRWLYGVEEWMETRSRSAAGIARARIDTLMAKPVKVEERINPFTNEPYTLRFVPPVRWKRFATLPPKTNPSCLCESWDGRLLAVGTRTGEIHLLRVRGGELLGVLKPKRTQRTRDAWIRRIVFSPSGKQLGALVGGLVRVWDVKTATSLWDAEDAKAHALDLAYHPDGNTIAVARSDGAAVFLDAQSGALRKRYDWKVGQLNSIAFSPDGLTCAAGGEKGQVVIWDVDS